MNYISTKEIAKKWGISTSRVAFLVKNGRIPEAQLVGNTWLFPQDCPKPGDLRTKVVKQAKSEDHFHFPLYHYHLYTRQEIESQFSESEKLLYGAQASYMHGHIQSAYQKLHHILNTTTDDVVRLGAIYSLAKTCIFLGHPDEFFHCVQQMHAILRKDIPHKKELEFLVYDIETYYHGNEFFTKDSIFDSSHSYHPTCRNYLLLLSIYGQLIKSISTPTDDNYAQLEMTIQLIENECPALMCTTLHMYISGLYILGNAYTSGTLHLKKALRLAIDNDILLPISYFYKYYPQLFDSLFDSDEYHNAKAIRGFCESFYSSLEKIFAYVGEDAFIFSTDSKDFEYIYYAYEGLTNKEIAARKHLSISSISKKYAEIYERYNVHTKKELIDLTSSSFVNYTKKS